MPSEDENAQLERSIVNGATTKAELIERLGLPIHELNDGRVLVFGGRNRPRGLLHLATEDKRDEHRLIAVIDETEILRDHLWVGKRTEARKLANAGAIAR